ncbi:MAG: ABC transporter ATP-binding protein [Sandaracinaceae bacterium]|nr:ABC transporter ATP-binding protein [Sandaracinaceae bacterium]
MLRDRPGGRGRRAARGYPRRVSKPDSPSLAARARELATTARRTIALVFATSRGLTVAFLAMTLVSGTLPAAMAWVGKQIVDGVVQAYLTDLSEHREAVLVWVGVELVLVLLLTALERARWLADSLLRAQLGQDVNERIIAKALEMSLADFEDAELYDAMVKARQGASDRPISVALGLFDFGRHTIALVAYSILLGSLSPWALLLVVLAAIPSFVVDTKYSEQTFRLFTWRAPEARKQSYLEAVLTRAEGVKEVKLFGLGPLFLARYRALHDAHYDEDRDRTLKQGLKAYLVGLLGTLAFYGTYAWVVLRTARGELSFGDMAMFVLVFQSAQKSIAGVLGDVRGFYEDLLYVTALFDLLDRTPSEVAVGDAKRGPAPDDGLRFEGVTFRYPGAEEPVLDGVTLHLPPGHKLALVGENGAGKTTLIKLMTGLYAPSAGRILLDGLPLPAWDRDALRARIGVIFQDFVRYQLLAGENVGVGDVASIDDEARWRAAAEKGLAHDVLTALPDGYHTQLGKWFADGKELSGGQWQKVALSRAFMREGADILVLDEPTASLDARAETKIFERFRALAEDRMAILISHRFSTVRMADTIAVLEGGNIVEHGSHEELLALGGRYATLFHMQARGYR